MMPVDLSGGRFYAGKSARARAPWPCPNCGVVNAGPLVGGCTNCGSGKPPESGIPNHAGVGATAGLTRSEVDAMIQRAVANTVIETLQRAGVMAPPLEATEPQGASALGADAADQARAYLARQMANTSEDERVVAQAKALGFKAPEPVVPLTLPEIDTSDPRVRLTIAYALLDWANANEGGEGPMPEGCISVIEAHALAVRIAPELVGEQVEPPPVDEAEAAHEVEVGEQHKREILSRLRAPNSK